MTERKAIRPLKRFGQNFLINHHVAEKIIDAINPQEHDIIVEIGAGKGALTKLLVTREVKQIIAVEVDSRLVNHINNIDPDHQKLRVVEDDFLNLRLADLNVINNTLKIIGNIPYHLTSSIIFKLIEDFRMISHAVLMIQKEVADRIVAKPGNKNYSLLSVLTGLHGTVTKEFEVGKKNFFPIPKVDSAVISIHFFEQISEVQRYDLFLRVVKGCFQTRRKMLQNSLRRIFNSDFSNHIPDIDLKKRPEELSVKDFIVLSNKINNLINMKSEL